MKNFQLFPALVLAASALAPAFAQTATAAPAAPAAAPAVAPTRVAIINITQAIMNTKEGQKAGTELQAKFTPRRTVLEKRQADIQGLQDQLKKGGATMSEAAKEKVMRDIDTNTRSLNHDADDLNADMEQENNKLMQDLGSKMMTILDQYAAQNGYAVVLDVSNQQNPVFWADASTVVTGDIIKLYDQAHPATAAAPKPAAPRPAAPASPKPAVPPATKKQ